METPFEAIVFDNDGLLLDTEHAWTRAETELFGRHGETFTAEHKRELIGTSREQSAANRAVAGAQLHAAGHLLDVDRAVATLGHDVRGGGQRDDQLRGPVVVEVDAESDGVLRLGDGDLDAIAVLRGLHVDDGDVFLVAPSLLDDDLDVRLVPRPNLD